VFTLLVEMRCNSFCVFCGSRELDEALVRSRRRLGLAVSPDAFVHSRERYTLETAAAVLEDARQKGYTELSLQGGEPTIFPAIVPLVQRAAAMGFSFVGLVTNGRRLANQAFARDLLDAGLSGLTFSLLGHDAATHDALSAAEGAFDQLMAGVDNCVAWAAERALPVRLNATLVVSARSIDHLPEQVRLLAAHGVRSAAIHLLRFDALASDPPVKAALSFELSRLRGPLAAALAVAREVGVQLNVTDLPLCQQVELTGESLELLEKHRAVARHSFAAMNHRRENHERRALLEGCTRCLLAGVCPGFPADQAPGAVDPVSASWVDDRIRESLGRGGEPPIEQVASLRHALLRLAPLLTEPEATGEAHSTLDRTVGGLMVQAARRGDAETLLKSFCAALGLIPPDQEPSLPMLLSMLGLPEDQLRRMARGRQIEPGPDETAIRFAHGFSVVLDADREGALRRATVVVPPGAGAALGGVAGALARRLFLVHLGAAVQGASRVEVRPHELRVELPSGGSRSWKLRYPDAVTLRPPAG
jgi:pyruvate-formate lyase-activating enzyme